MTESTEEYQGNNQFILKGIITIEDLFKGNLDDLDEFFTWKVEQLKAKLPPEKRETTHMFDIKELIQDAAGPLEMSTIRFLASIGKFGTSKKNPQLSSRISFDLLEKKDRMIMTEHFSWQQIYLLSMIAVSFFSSSSVISSALGKGIPDGAQMITKDNIDGLPDEIKEKLGEIAKDILKRLGEDGKGF